MRVLLSQLTYRNPPIACKRVLDALQALQRADIRTILIGGWGIDALAGRQLRPHADLDLLVAEDRFAAAIAVLKQLGYQPWNRSEPGPIGDLPRFSAAQSLRDQTLRVIELHAVDLDLYETATGTVGGQPVVCLTAEQQMRAQRLVGRNWTRGQRLKQQSNLAAITFALQQDSQNL